VEVYLHAFLTSALNTGEWSASCPGRFTPGAPYLLERRPGGPQSWSPKQILKRSDTICYMQVYHPGGRMVWSC